MRFAWLNLPVLILFAAANFSLAAAADSPADAFPDVYPSAAAATSGVGEQITTKLRTVSPAFTNVLIRQQNGSSISNDVVNDFTTLLAARFPKSKVQIDRITNPPPTTEPVVALSGSEWWTGSGSRPSGSQPDHGEIIANLTGPISAAVRGNFLYKPWLADFSSFSNANPTSTWLIAKSTTHCSTPADADESARDDLAHQLAANVENRLQSSPLPHSDADIYLQARNMLRGDIQLDDKFLQRFDGPHGSSWQEALLYNTQNQDVPNLISFALTSSGSFASGAQSHLSSFASMIALTIVILLLYAFLNGISKGYFQRRLMVVAIVFGVIGAIAFFVLLFGHVAVQHPLVLQ